VDNATRLKRLRFWHCNSCHKMFSVTAGTPMAETKLPLRKWFAAIYLVASSSKGISSVALARQIGVGQKTAWFLSHRIRQMMDTDTNPLSGVVEADETYIGGKRKRDTKSKRDDDDDQPKGRGGTRKMMAVTAVERGGRAKARRGATHSGRDIAKALYDWTDRNSILLTDELPAYRWIGRKFRQHHRVNHSRHEWSRKAASMSVHTNTVESFNATIKRAIIGVWHWFSIKHANRYLSELSARWNLRDKTAMERFDAAINGLLRPALPWKALAR
jgi:transposase-like protein